MLTPVSAAAVYVLAGLPSLVWILGSLAAQCRPTLGGGRRLWGRLSHYGFRSYGVDLCGILAVYLDQALVVGLLSASSMGIYAVALSLSRVISAIHASVAMIVFPRVVGLAPEAMVAAVGRSARVGTIASTIVGLAVVAAGPALLGVVVRRVVRPPAGVILPILVAEAIVAGLAQVLLQGFLAAGRPGVATMVLGLGLAGSVPLFLVLVPAFGVVGASIALLGALVAARALHGAGLPLGAAAGGAAPVDPRRGPVRPGALPGARWWRSVARVRAAGDVE